MNEQIRICLEEFRKMYKLNEHEPIKNIFSIVDDSFLILKFPNKMGISGLFIEKKDRDKVFKCIYINTSEPRGRQNFSFAHELYHVHFKKSTNGVCLIGDREKEDVEKEAEMFASNLLIPRYTLLFDFKKFNLSSKTLLKEEHVFMLQRKYNVTFQSIIYATEDMKKYAIYEKFYKFIPVIPKCFKKYFTSSWDKLKELSNQYNEDLDLNSPDSIYEFPEYFKRNLISSYERGLTGFDELEEIFSFFNSEYELKKYL